MERNAVVGWLLGGAGIVIALVALVVAISASGGDSDGASNAEMSAMIANMTAQSAELQTLADQVSSLQAELAAADSDRAMMQAAMDEMSAAESPSQDTDTADYTADIEALNAAIDEVRGMAADTASDLVQSADAVSAMIEAHIDDHIDVAMVEEALGKYETYHTAVEASLQEAVDSLEEHLNEDDHEDDEVADAVAALQERLAWLETAAAPAFTQSYVAQATRRFDADGMQAAFDYYNTMDSVSGDLYLFVVDSDYKVVVHPTVPLNIGMDIRGPGGTDITGYNFGAEFVSVDESGKWIDYVYLNPTADFAYERKHSWLVRHKGFIFGSGWYERDVSLDKDPQAFTRAFVAQARARYDANGRDAAIAYYNDPASVDGQWYVFIADEDDTLIASAPHPDLVGDDIKTIVDDDGYELGVEIAKATEQGHWIEYLWPNPASGAKERKRTWVIRHDGLIFGSGYYEGPGAATAGSAKAYVDAAIARYNADGRQATLAHYNTQDSVQGELYLFVLDESGEVLAHATVPSNVGQNIDGPLGTDATGYNFGADTITADENGKWIDYVYVNPADDFAYERKHSWVIKHDGLIFGSGWYERDLDPDTLKADPRAYARALVAQATARYDANGRDAIAAQYNRPDSVDGQWYVFIVDKDDNFLAHAATPARVGTDVKALTDANGYAHGQAIAEATEAGGWLQYTRVNPLTGANQLKHSWVMRHKGLIFGSGYYEGGASAGVQAYVQDAIDSFNIYPDPQVQQAALNHYNSKESVEGDLYLFVIDRNNNLIVHPTVPANVGESIVGPLGTDVTGYNFGADMVTADENGKWVDYVYLNPAADFAYERKHSWVIKRDGLIFGSGWYDRDLDPDTLKADPRAYARALVRQAIARYDAKGRSAIAQQYNHPDSVDGQWYVFIVDKDDNFLAHAATPERVGTDVKALTDANGYAHGQAISEATEDGGWLEYTRINPATGMNQPKHSWVIKHDGLIFGSGYYE